MKTALHFLRNNLVALVLFIVWLVVAIPNLNIYWMLVDDGWDVVFSRTLFEKISSFNFIGLFSQLLEGNGRFRPVYWFWQMMVWLIGKNSYQFQHFAHMLVIGLTILFIYLIINELTNSKLIAFFSSITYLLIPINTENILRLGPQEPLLVLFLSVLFYFLVKNRKAFLPCLILILAVFSKETSVAILPPLFFYYFYGRKSNFIKNKKQGFYLWITICISSIILILITFLTRGGYSTNYYFNIPMFVSNLSIFLKELGKNNLYVFSLVVTVYLIRIIITLINKRKILYTKLDFFEFLSSLSFLCFLFIQLPWKYALTRYLMPTIFFLIVFSFIEIYKDIQLLGKLKFISGHKQIFIVLLTLAGIYISVVWGFQLVFMETSSVSNFGAFKKMAGYPEDSIILMNMQEGENTIELVDETKIQLSEFWGRKDIKVEYLDLEDLPKDSNYIIVDSDNFLRNYPHDELTSKYENHHVDVISMSEHIIPTTPLEFVKLSIKKLFNFLVYRRKLTPEGLYTYYYYNNNNNWYFYNGQ